MENGANEDRLQQLAEFYSQHLQIEYSLVLSDLERINVGIKHRCPIAQLTDTASQAGVLIVEPRESRTEREKVRR